MSLQFHPYMIVAALLVACASAYLARRMGRNPYLWFAIGALFGVFGVFAIFFIPQKSKPTKPTPIFTIQGPIDKLWYYLDAKNEQKGPMSRDAVATAWKEGKINLATHIWHEELKEWKPFRDLLKET